MTATIAAVRGRVSELDRRVASGAVAGGLPSLAALYLLTLRTDPLSMSPDMVSVTSSAWQLAHHGTPRLRRRVCLQLMDHSLRTRVRGQQSRAGIDRLGGRVLLTAAVHRDPEPRTGVARSRTPHRRRNGDARVGAALPGARTGGADRGVDRGNGDYHLGVSSASLWPHGPDQLYLAVAMLGLAAEREAWAGVAFAAALLTRPPLAIVAAVTGIWQSWSRRSIRPLLLIGMAAGIGLIILLRYAAVFWHGGLDSQYDAAGGALSRRSPT